MTLSRERFIDRREIEETIRRQFVLSLRSIHGPSHWKRVEEIGLRLAIDTGADRDVITLFALYHDSRRELECDDPRHGERGALLALEHRGKLFDLDDASFEKLYVACVEHTDGHLSEDPTIGACWDADRLDLSRLGIKPRVESLSTGPARDPAMVAWAWELSNDARRFS
ncbi:MAG TPA: hypothetical protein VK116_19565 [Planctomycetota bacterium]|nr:hypothetical protein [Planctomycetota bacterium]